jgi:glycosyltransferase involved in cell wall biosynthesis
METFYVNGKFTAQRTTGVQRVASRLVLALDGLIAPAERWVLLCPPGGAALPLARVEQRWVGRRGWPLHVWEQGSLPWAARRGLLLNLSGSAPWFARRQAALLHDAAVFDHPEAYTAPFVAWYQRLFRRLGRRAERLFTVSTWSRDRLAAALGVAPARFHVLRNGAEHLDAVVPDDDVLVRHSLRGRRFLLAVASDNPTKNLPALVQAVGRMADPGLRLVIAGGRNERVFAAADAGADPSYVVRTGPLHDAALTALYRHALAFVFPSYYEGFGLPTLEAMALGCPVAAARAAALPETCGAAALYFEPHDVDDIAAALRRLLDEPALRAGLGAAGRAHAANCRWNDAAAALRTALGTAP